MFWISCGKRRKELRREVRNRRGYDQNIIAEHRHLTRVSGSGLDGASCICDHVTSHFMYVNPSMALRIAGIDEHARPAGRRDPPGTSREPTGVLEETAVDLIWYKDELGFLGTRDEKHPRAEGSHGLLCRQRLYHGQSGPCGRRGDHAGGRKQGYLGIRCTLWSAPEPAAKYAKRM